MAEGKIKVEQEPTYRPIRTETQQEKIVDVRPSVGCVGQGRVVPQLILVQIGCHDRNIAAFKRFFPLRAGFNQDLPVAVVVRQVETGVKKQRAAAYGGRIELGIEVDEGRQTAVVGRIEIIPDQHGLTQASVFDVDDRKIAKLAVVDDIKYGIADGFAPDNGLTAEFKAVFAAAALDKQIVQLPLGLYSVPVTDIFIILIPVYAIPHASLQHPAGSESVLVADIELQPIGLQVGFLGKAAEGAQIDGVIIGLP